MRLRLNWLLLIIIYLSVNGQVFATAIHICSEMALTSAVLSSSSTTVNIHEHQAMEHHEDNKAINKVHDTDESTTMDNCHCVGCDCVQDITGQANPSLLQDTRLSNFFPVITIILSQLNRAFISLPYSNPYRPPITV